VCYQSPIAGHGVASKKGRTHMNGRVYDPILGRFLSVDPVFQFPTNTQSLNPYSYVLNNPLSATDPTGYTSNCTAGQTTGCPPEGQSGSSSSQQSTTQHVSYTPTGSHIAVSGNVTATAQANGNLAVSGDNKTLSNALSAGAKSWEGGNGASTISTPSSAQNKPTSSAGIGSPGTVAKSNDCLSVNWSDGNSGNRRGINLGDTPIGGASVWTDGWGSARTLDAQQFGEVQELARLGYAEEKDPHGTRNANMIAAAEQVVLARVASHFDGRSTIDGVISESAQFNAYGGTLWNQAANPSALTGNSAANYAQALNSALLEYTGAMTAPINGATYYYNLGIGNPPKGFFTNDIRNGRLNYRGAVLPSMLLLGPPSQ